jgi:sugar lactone lactonase YvrE
MAALLAIPLAAGAQGAGKPGDNADQPSLPALQQKVQEAVNAENYDQALQYVGRMAQRLPYDGKLMYEAAALHALNGNKQQAFTQLISIQRQGLNYSPRGDGRFDSLTQYQLFGHLADELEKNGQPFDKAEQALVVEAALQWPQAIARHGADGDFFLGGLGQGRILRVGPNGNTETFFEPGDNGPAGISALAVDAGRGVLWAAGTAIRQSDEQGLSVNMNAAALYRFDLKSGELQGHFPIADDRPLPHLFNEIAVGPDGEVYAADVLSPLVYRYTQDGDSLEPFVGAPGLSGFHGIAVTPDGKHLLVSEWRTGLYRISVADRQAHRLEAGQFVNLGGLHSLSFRNGKLYAVQTGTNPKRVVRIELSEGLERAESMFPLSASQPEYGRPGLGVLAGDGYYFVADSGWSLSEGPGNGGGSVTVLKADPELGSDVQRPKMPVKSGGDIEGYQPADGFRERDEPSGDKSGEENGDPEG